MRFEVYSVEQSQGRVQVTDSDGHVHTFSKDDELRVARLPEGLG